MSESAAWKLLVSRHCEEPRSAVWELDVLDGGRLFSSHTHTCFTCSTLGHPFLVVRFACKLRLVYQRIALLVSAGSHACPAAGGSAGGEPAFCMGAKGETCVTLGGIVFLACISKLSNAGPPRLGRPHTGQ